MSRRKGRHRKSGRRERNGRIHREPAATPREIAARMPHRRGLGELAVDQRAETELGRLTLRGTLTPDQGLAGETYRSLWQGYVYTLGPPRGLGNGHRPNYSCNGCPDVAARKYCRCDFRRKVYEEARRVLYGRGLTVGAEVYCVVILDRAPTNIAELRDGLDGLACHFGLTKRANRVRNLQWLNASPAQ